MGLTYTSGKKEALKDLFNVEKDNKDDIVVALAGNPNTGKSTVFNALTGLHQHTGNWPGKTVTNAQGKYNHKEKNFIVVDLPGTYSLLASSIEEQVARDFICFGKPDVVVVVVDATSVERNLNLLLQILEITPRVVVSLNLMDEAKKREIKIDINKLRSELGVPVIPTIARSNKGIYELKDIVYNLALENIKTNPVKVEYSNEIECEIKKISSLLEKVFPGEISLQWLALRLLDGDESILNSISKYLNYDMKSALIKGGLR
ncbi:FeoB small GTPase domain-containing protein [Clostridium botulinum]|uniref:Ferrous iron transport protein B n=2 Tax=Clostridium botulinum TaxID=1491 RepID=C1FUN8_CLOBJ|nr:FeoB small GTPase domain-containing protein [Clostridium botulinum]ACO84784.1 ferrous iron transport protein B [Clostridium botulinum A2 str. Kyoto]APH22694.1 ferrous iron transport B family protein [Clostridium botulinum]APQ67672.1 ferrous iron transport B family protein [Clostridium botulinum]AUN06009.1 iron transporter FeoB [Clostridium botulinum]AUN16916.1 iron transporter FeoB [Clostridium botulinum]